jgi:hypothetical protein
MNHSWEKPQEPERTETEKMKLKATQRCLLFQLGICCALALSGTASSAAPAANAAPAKAKAQADDDALVEIPESVFIIPSTPKEGRDPFFPQSTRTLPVAPKTPKQPRMDISAIVLNGIVPSGPKRTAMINGRTFEVGEEADVRLPDGTKMHVKCEEIKEDSATIKVNGQTRELRLRRGA